MEIIVLKKRGNKMRTKRLTFLFCVVALMAVSMTSLFADGTDWYYDKPIRSITFEGLQNVKSSDLEGVTSGFIGKKFSDDVFADLLNRIYALDYFDDVSPQAGPGSSDKSTVTTLFTVVERPIITKITYAGNKQIRNSELKDAVSIKEKDVFIQSKMLIDERAIRDLYLGKGYTNVKVTSTATTTDEGMEVVFNIDEGQETVVGHIGFEGNLVVAEKTLKGKISLEEVGLFKKGAFQESMLEADKQAIVAYYKKNGYIDAEVVDIKQERNFNSSKNRDELTITFVVKEGSQYTFGGITFKGNEVFSSEQLEDLVKLRTGCIAVVNDEAD